jgi:hypothetical protein
LLNDPRDLDDTTKTSRSNKYFGNIEDPRVFQGMSPRRREISASTMEKFVVISK